MREGLARFSRHPRRCRSAGPKASEVLACTPASSGPAIRRVSRRSSRSGFRDWPLVGLDNQHEVTGDLNSDDCKQVAELRPARCRSRRVMHRRLREAGLLFSMNRVTTAWLAASIESLAGRPNATRAAYPRPGCHPNRAARPAVRAQPEPHSQRLADGLLLHAGSRQTAGTPSCFGPGGVVTSTVSDEGLRLREAPRMALRHTRARGGLLRAVCWGSPAPSSSRRGRRYD